MSNIISTCDGDILDLDTADGQYKYLGKFLCEHGASSRLWAALSNIHRLAKEREEQSVTTTPADAGKEK
jgi:hypothetical protein